MSRLWLDDVRPAPEGFDVVCRTYEEAIEALSRGGIDFVSLDHDLGFDHYSGTYADGKTGYDVACYIEGEVSAGRMECPGWTVHSMNPAGAARIRAVLSRFRAESLG